MRVVNPSATPGGRLVGAAFAAVVLAVCLAPPPARAAGAIAGTASTRFPGCPRTNDNLQIVGASADNQNWELAVADVTVGAKEEILECTVAVAGVYSGRWNPSQPGNSVSGVNCLANDQGGRLCLGAVSKTLTATAASISVCLPMGAGCTSGAGSLVLYRPTNQRGMPF
jgi:hypothetical protein